MNYTIEELSNKYNELKNTIEQNNKKIEGIKIDIEDFIDAIELINVHGDIKNQIRISDEQINELKSYGSVREKEIKELEEKREYMSAIQDYIRGFDALESKEKQLEILNTELEKLKNQVKDLEKTNTKKENIMSNLKQVCDEKKEALQEMDKQYNNESEIIKQNNKLITKNCRPLTLEMRKVEERLNELDELEFLTKSQIEEKENLKNQQEKITSEFKKIIPNSKEILTSEEMFNSYILNKEQYKENNATKELERINNLINEIENFSKKEEPVIEQPIENKEQAKEDIVIEQPIKEQRTLADVIKEYQDVKNDLKELSKNNSTDINKMIDLLQKQNELELEIKQKTTEFNEKEEQKQEKIITEQKELTEQEKIEQNNRKVFDDIISKRNLKYDDKYDMNHLSVENTNSFINDVKKLYEQKQEEDYENAKKMLENDPSMTLKDLRKKLKLEIDPSTVNKIFDRFEKEQKIDNPLTEDKIAKMKEIEQQVKDKLNNEAKQSADNTLTEDKIAKMREIEQQVKDKLNETLNKEPEQIMSEEKNVQIKRINEPEQKRKDKTVENVVYIAPEDRIFTKREKEIREMYDEIYDGKQELNDYTFAENKAIIPEKESETLMSNYEIKKEKSKKRLLDELSNKKEIEKKVKRKTSKEEYSKRRTKIGTKIANILNGAKQIPNKIGELFLTELENVDELEERMGRSR